MKSWLKRTLLRKAAAANPPTPAPAADPTALEALIEAGQALEDAGQPAEALARYQQALQLDPHSAKAHLNAGNAQRLLGDNAGAIASYRRATELDPERAGAHLNLGTALFDQGQFAAAELAYRSALRLRPDWVDAWIGLGCALEEGQAMQEAAAAYSRALTLKPDHLGAAVNLSALQIKILDVGGARQTLREFLRHVPGQRDLMQRLATVELDAGRLDESLAVQRALIEQQPDDWGAWNVLLFNLSYHPDVTAAASLAEHRRFGELLESRITPRGLSRPGPADRRRKLRVGYVSGDFYIHPIANFIHPVLRCHDRREFEVYCYYTQTLADRLTAELKGLADHWRDAAALDDEALADLIQQDRIDILVDLSGHSGSNRLGVFARKPAPVQYTWFGHLGTTGLSRMDYRLCDGHTDPAGLAEQWQTETPARLPDSQWCYDQRFVEVPAASPLPRLRNGYWTFGSFNNYRKLNARVFAAWAELLRAIPDSRLRLFSFENAESGERVVSAIAAHGIGRERLSWHLRTSPQGHFESFAGIDIALDSFPYNGATTTCDALLMGVPVLAIAGQRSLSRGGLSLLSSAGMADWVAESAAQLPALALRQLADTGTIAQLRAELPQRLRSSPLMDAPRFTRHLESQYHAGWQRWCDRADAR